MRYPDDERLTVRLPRGTRRRLDVVAAVRAQTASELVREMVLGAIEATERRWLRPEDR